LIIPYSGGLNLLREKQATLEAALALAAVLSSPICGGCRFCWWRYMESSGREEILEIKKVKSEKRKVKN
jgi:hypothetical protein